jgi:hypothetical protein
VSVKELMNGQGDKVLIRAKDISLLILVLTFFGMVMGPLKKIFKLEDVIVKVEKLEASDDNQNEQLTVIKTQYTEIDRKLERLIRRSDRDR